MQTEKHKDRRLMAEINVTPLVDVTLVLLIIFMVTTPMLQRGVDVELPQAQSGDVREEEKITLTLTRDNRIFINDKEVPRTLLTERLQELSRERRDRVVFFRGDAQVSYGLVMEVMDAAKAAGIEVLGMITQQPNKK
jgi:biopolymer transport protein TolR